MVGSGAGRRKWSQCIVHRGQGVGITFPFFPMDRARSIYVIAPGNGGRIMSQSVEVSPTCADTDPGGAGFLFCFKKQSACTWGSDSVSNLVIGTVVDVLTWSDFIHVEIVPVRAYDSDAHTLRLSPHSYTAFMTIGFVSHASVECCDSPIFTHLYLPADAARTMMGRRFLETLVGVTYNRRGMWDAFWHQFSRSADWHQTHPLMLEKKPVFCSEAALMLCYLIGVYDGPLLPQHCTPKALYDILQSMNCIAFTDLCGIHD